MDGWTERGIDATTCQRGVSCTTGCSSDREALVLAIDEQTTQTLRLRYNGLAKSNSEFFSGLPCPNGQSYFYFFLFFFCF